MNLRRLLLPNLSVTIWLIFFVALNVSNWRLVMISADGDPALHRRIGEWMIENREVIRTEQFSHTRFGAELISKEWLSEVIFSVMSLAFGWNGVILLAAFLIATTLWLLHRQLLVNGAEPLLATLLVLMTAFAATTHWLARPHLVTHLLVVVFGWLLHDYRNDRCSARRLWATLPALMCLWTNLHGAFFTGFILIGLFFVGAIFEKRRDRAVTLAGVLTACLAASLVNPNGWNLHLQVIGFLRTPELSGMVNEFRSPNFHSGGAKGLLFELFAIALLLLVVRPVLAPTEILLLGVWGYFALHSVRNVPVFALVAAPILARHYQPFLRHPLWLRLSARANNMHTTTGGYVLAALAGIGLLVVVSKPSIVGGWETEILTNRVPVAALEFVRQNPTAVQGEMFNEYGWGGYLLWAMPERKVFIDGRNDFFGKELCEEFNTVDRTKPGWEAVLEKYKVGWTLLPPKHPLNALLSLDTGGWTNNYHDEVAVIYSRR
ncbi:MAG: hypothetical protein PCFJNLEI_02310 [Verrucomicrobiae bacterium]|nr:hypothetical protein [Verrucomicrobiae bacterium]